jgi:protease-4
MDNPQSTPPQIIIQQQRTWFGRFGKLLLVLLGLAVMYIFAQRAMYESYVNPATGPQERLHSLNETATSRIAVISVAGTILEGDTFVKDQIDRVKEDDNVVGVVLRINSPGGTVTYSDYLYHHLRELVEERELPLVVSMGSICASGGYYISMAVGDQPDSIFAEPTTWTGSIGVIIPHYDLTGLMAEIKVKDDSVASGEHKQMLSMTREMPPEERALAQAYVDESFARFKEIIKQGRPLFKKEPETLDQLATGEIFTAAKAQEHGLVDKIGFVEDAIDRAIELARLNKDDVRVVRYAPEPSLLGDLSTPFAQSRGLLDERTLLELSVPRAYYLLTTLPGVAAR